jgi:glycine/D-amino acid oxidase-like deaminating enzyme
MTKRIVVIGGGVVGCSIAWHLAQRNLGEVVLLEQPSWPCGRRV